MTITMQLQLKLGLYNVENLFLLFDQELPQHYMKLNEAQWQKFSNSVYENKDLKKCISIANIINTNSPDIMMLCEVGGGESLSNFNRYFLNNAYETALIEGNSDRNIDVGFLIKKDLPIRFKIKTNKEYPLNYLYPHENQSVQTGYPIKAPTQYFSRDCAELHLMQKNSDETMMVVLLTHLKSRLDPERIDPGGLEKRSAEVRTLVELYNNLTKKLPNTPIILCGDMNGYAGKHGTDEEFKLIYEKTDLQDVLEIDNVSLDKRYTFYQIKNSGKSEGKQIDYCFIPQKLSDNVKKKSAQVYRYKDEFGFDIEAPRSLEAKLLLASDHYPIFFTLENIKF